MLLFVVNEAYFFLSHRIRLATRAIDAGFEVHLAAPDHHTWAPEGFDVADIERLGIILHTISLSRRGQNVVEEMRTFLSLLRVIRDLRPDVVHLITIKPIIYGGLVARLLRVPAVVVSITGLGHVFSSVGLRSRVRRWLVSCVLRRSLAHPNATTIVQSQGDRDALLRLRLLSSDARLTVIRGAGVDLNVFRRIPEPTGNAPIVLLAARLLWDKGVGEFVDAARSLRSQGCNAQFVIAGDTQSDNPRSVPRDVLDAWNNEGVVAWIGRQSNMAALLSSAAIVCLPTRYGEGVPRILLEAAAAGRPIVASDIPGCREVVQDNINGLLVRPGDAGALARALSDLLKDPDRRREMGERGGKIAKENFDVESVAEETVSIYREILASAEGLSSVSGL
ncbi:MAG: glycosyltransferase family 4 protein [Alphaproteobacteria bacterium]|nr:glycosyltransferase family 4 protein [Alphaproteobacteria bacterium]